MKTASKTQLALKIMYILCWITAIGISIKAGAYMISFGVSLFNPIASNDLYLGFGLLELREISILHYSIFTLLIIGEIILEGVMVFQLIKILKSVDLYKPFQMKVADSISRLSLILFSIWAISIFTILDTFIMELSIDFQIAHEPLSAYLLVAGLVFIIAQVFKHGVEMQQEQELTV
jgi:hypothetical protein